jgi:stearoyl-CoA desaturase (delta-9 desaturase)
MDPSLLLEQHSMTTKTTSNSDHEMPPFGGYWMRLLNLCAVIIPFAGFIAAITLLWGVAFNWTYLGLLLGMYLVSALGITVGFHRLFTHRSFTTPRFVTAILVVCGSMAVQGSLIQWVGTHRRHHQESDKHGDPHSPHTHGAGFRGMLRGFMHSHVGWLFRENPLGLDRYVPDLKADALTRRMSMLFPVWVVLGLAIPAAIGGLVTMSWMGVLLGFIWGGLARVFLVHHVTWSINSVCHIWGTQPFRSHDHSRNNPIFGYLALGEGWHNNHHAFPTSARHGLRWWELDLSWIVIRLMMLLRLASNVRTPSKDRIAAKRTGMAPPTAT